MLAVFTRIRLFAARSLLVFRKCYLLQLQPPTFFEFICIFVLFVILNVDRLCPVINFIVSTDENFRILLCDFASVLVRLWFYVRLWPLQCACP
jgi:hypothetical protein